MNENDAIELTDINTVSGPRDQTSPREPKITGPMAAPTRRVEIWEHIYPRHSNDLPLRNPENAEALGLPPPPALSPPPGILKKCIQFLFAVVVNVAACVGKLWPFFKKSDIPLMASSPPVSAFGVLSASSPGCYAPLYPSFSERDKASMVLLIGLLAVGLDAGLMANVIPTITKEFGSYEDLGWYASAYLLPMAALQPFFRTIYRLFIKQRTYLLCLVIFEIGMIISFRAVTSITMILGRAITGVGASGLLQGTHSVASLCYRPHMQAFWVSTLFSVIGIISIFSPLIGGFLAEIKSWRVCFLLNLPVACIAIVCLIRHNFPQNSNDYDPNMPYSQRLGELRPDFFGAIFLIISLILAIVGLQWVGTFNHWNSRESIILSLSFVGAMAIFWSLQMWWTENATVPLRVACKKDVIVGALCFFALQMVLVSHTYLIPIYFQSIIGFGPLFSGLFNMVYYLAAFIGYSLSVLLVCSYRFVRPVAVVATTIMCAGCWMLSTMGVAPGWERIIGYQFLTGIGIGMALQMPFVVTPAVFNDTDVYKANMVIVYLGLIGGIIAIPAIQAIISNALLGNLPKLTDEVDPRYILSLGVRDYHHMPELTDKVRELVLRVMSQAVKDTFRFAFIAASFAMGASFFFGGRFAEQPVRPEWRESQAQQAQDNVHTDGH